ncbi:MAG: BREX protein BrxB domain-containing protein [Desulfomonilaceae bacterium]
MDTKFKALMEILKEPLKATGGVKTDNSILMIYPPERELDFREYLMDNFVPQLSAKGLSYRLLDLTGFIFEGLDHETILDLQEEEFEDYRWMKQGLSKRVERSLIARISALAKEVPGGSVIVHSTVAIYPLIRLGDVLRELRDLPIRCVIAFPGEERGGRLHFMNQPDGGNYLAVKLA